MLYHLLKQAIEKLIQRHPHLLEGLIAFFKKDKDSRGGTFPTDSDSLCVRNSFLGGEGGCLFSCVGGNSNSFALFFPFCLLGSLSTSKKKTKVSKIFLIKQNKRKIIYLPSYHQI